MRINTVAIIGMGALGLMYADHIVKNTNNTCSSETGNADCNTSDSVSFVMDSDRVQKYRDAVFTVNNQECTFKLISEEEAAPVDLLIVAVKYTALPTIYESIRRCCDDHTIVMSVMNGITSENLIKENCGCKNVIYTVAQGMDAMKFGNSVTFSKMGELHIGVLPGADESSLNDVCEYFERINMPYVKEEDILYRMWFKFMLNVGINQICMIYEVGYGIATTPGTEPYRTLISAMREVEVLALKEGVSLAEEDINGAISILKTLNPESTPSMGQDRIAKRKSEVDMFAGTIIELGKKHNVAVPTNAYIYECVQNIEAAY